MTGYLRLLITVYAVALSFGTLHAQEILPDTTASRLAASNAIAIYHNYMGDESRIFNGIEHYGYLPMNGHPYFMEDSTQNGDLVYENILYRHVPLLYDIIRDVVVVASPNGDLMSIAGEKISGFYFLGHHFVNTPIGYCDLLVSGPVILEARRTKRILENIEGLQVVRNIEYSDHYFIVKDGVRHSIGNLRSLLALIKDKKKEINQDLRRKKIKYKRQPEQALVEAVTYYNQSRLQ